MRAHAKVNLFLHVGDRRPDGYHNLVSLVAFAEYGDEVTADSSNTLTMHVTGPFAGETPHDDSNIMLKAAKALREYAARSGQGDAASLGAALHLTKNLPPASGIGGGSADAAATLHLLNRLWRLHLSPVALAQIGVKLGADLPVCLSGQTALMRGLGEIVEPLASLPTIPIVLVNPGVPVSTPEIFRRLTIRTGHTPPDLPPRFANVQALATFLRTTHNDLAAPARVLAPEIAQVLTALNDTPACLLSRMSGSGATCFALYESQGDATNAATLLKTTHPNWWIRATTLL